MTRRSQGTRRRSRRARAVPSSYSEAGVDSQKEESGLTSLIQQLHDTLTTRSSGLGHAAFTFGFFAAVVEIAEGVGLAISTDGVGTKVLVAQSLNKYDTIGIDCVAMNVNDVLCVGAEPLALVDYLAVQEPDPYLLGEIAKGLREGALQARITIPGGEIAQVKEILKGVRPGHGFDLAGTAVGTVPLDRVLVGQNIEAEDVVLGIPSTGVHSNGLTLARQLFARYKPSTYLKELGRTLGEELLTPTRIYVREVMDVLKGGVDVKALVHITGDGFLNMLRVASPTSYVIEWLPEPPPIFNVIERELRISRDEMYRVYNMGIGFCLVVSHRGDHAARAMEIIKRHNIECYQIGRTVSAPEQSITIEPEGLVGTRRGGTKGGTFHRL